MIPKYAFQVEVTYKTGETFQRQTHNYETLDGAYAYSAIALKRPGTKRVKVMVVISDNNPLRIED